MSPNSAPALYVYHDRKRLMNRSTEPPSATKSPVPRRRKSIEILEGGLGCCGATVPPKPGDWGG
jgi:hypothetical protein